MMSHEIAVNLFSIEERLVVLTGVSGQLGNAYAKSLVENGAWVAGIDLIAEPLFIPPHDSPGRYFHVQADVTSRDSLSAALKLIENHFGRTPWGLINNAAIDSPPNSPIEENGPFETYPKRSFDRVLDVNVSGTMLSCQVFGERMAECGGGVIINVSSTYGIVSPDQRIYEYRRGEGRKFYKPISYAVSKSAILNLTRYLATYWAGKNVRVNTLTPGGVFHNQDKEFVNEYVKRVPLGRMANENEYNGAIIFLLSDASSYMTGSNMIIDGGWTAW